MADFLFVHGEFSGAWCWDAVIGLLEDALREREPLLHEGFTPGRLVAVNLPGPGAQGDSRQQVRLRHYVEAVVESARGLHQPVLVAHSAGAGVAAMAAPLMEQKPRRAVFLGGILPRNRRSLLSAFHLPARLTVEVMGLAPGSWREGVRFPRQLFAWALTPDMDYPSASMVMGRSRPQPLWPLLEPVEWEPFRGLCPVTYLVLARDRFFPPHLQRGVAERLQAQEVVELDAGHYAMVTHPQEVAQVLLRYA